MLSNNLLHEANLMNEAEKDTGGSEINRNDTWLPKNNKVQKVTKSNRNSVARRDRKSVVEKYDRNSAVDCLVQKEKMQTNQTVNFMTQAEDIENEEKQKEPNGRSI